MKKSILTVLILLLSGISLTAQTEGDLTVSVGTSEAGGNFAPRNIVAIWVEDDAGNFVKTLLAYAATRITHLNIWQASTAAAGTEFNRVDAITGATRTSYSTRNSSWDATDYTGLLVPDGNYNLWMELTDQNGTGNFTSFPFVKDTNPANQTPADAPSFSNISINWDPVNTSGVTDIEAVERMVVYPNPSKDVFTIIGEDIQGVEVRNSFGKRIYTSNDDTIDLSNHPTGMYWILIKTNNQTIVKKLLKE